MDIDYHTVGEDIITVSNTVDNDEGMRIPIHQWNVNQTHHVPVHPSS